MTNPDPPQSQIQEELRALEASFHHLKLEYERYFLGQRPTEPTRERADLVRGLQRPGREPIRNTASRFALVGLKDRFQTFSRRWDRTQGEIEAGTYTRHLFKARLRDSSARGASLKNESESGDDLLFRTYREASEACGRNTDGLTKSRFKEALAQHRAQMSQKYGGAAIEFDVQVDGNRVKLRARPQA